MKLKLLLLLAVVFPIAGLVVWTGLEALAGGRPQMDYYTALALEQAGVSPDDVREAATEPAGPPPRVEMAEEEYRFGTMEVGDKGRHEFLVRNTGEGELHLTPGQTSCKCTLVDIPDGVVPPGGECRVKLEWETPKAQKLFRHGAYIETNDPARPEFSLTVCGQVRAALALSQASVVFTSVSPGERPTAEVLVYSEVWPDLAIVDVGTSLPQLECELSPADPAVLTDMGATCGQHLEVRLAPGLPEGPFRAQLRLRARPAGQPNAEPLTRLLNVEGVIGSDFTIVGPGYHRAEGLQLGLLAPGKGAQRTVQLFAPGDISIREVRVRPEVVQVHVRRDELGKGTKAHYVIEVEVPADAPAMDCLGRNVGEITIETDHPQTPRIHIPLAFAVESKR